MNVIWLVIYNLNIRCVPIDLRQTKNWKKLKKNSYIEIFILNSIWIV